MVRFANWWFLLLIPVAAYLFWLSRRRRGLKFSSVKLLIGVGAGKTIKDKIGKMLIFCGIILSLAAMARPQSTENIGFISQRGVDIAVILDVSGSMQSVDFEPNRMEVARKTTDNFISQRASDRVSLIIFAGTAYTRVPLTLDHNIVRESLAQVTTESVNTDGTAIGMAISVGINRLEKSDAASRIMILLTDGDNNMGAIDPLTASKLAQDLGIRIYTIGVGSDTMVIPVQVFGMTQFQQYPGGFNEELLKQIAENTGGQYFRALEPKALSQIFDTINQLEKTEFNNDNFTEYIELAFPLIKTALVLLMVGIILDKFYFVQIP
ncbi:MAG: VWA domain-containing protein [Oscillospiraceae bacterium]|nr:VWA domain-containing protein [Oscillospiraceae bacterium]